MAQIQVSVAIVINPAPLQANPSSASVTEVQGQPSTQQLAAISGGKPPYTVLVDPQSPEQIPPGLSFSVDANNNLVLDGTPTGVGAGTVLLDISDSQ